MTRLYFHAAASGVSGTLPSTEQSTLTAAVNVDAQSVNRSMSTTIGTSYISRAVNTNASSTLQNIYVTKFVSEPVTVTSISANTWTYAFAAYEGDTNANFPVSGTDQPVYLNVYVWRPSNGTKVGTVIDGNTASTVDEGPVFDGTFHIVTFSGSAVTCQSGDVVICEIWFRVTQASATSYTNYFYYDGTTVHSENQSITSPASYIETPETLTFSGELTRVTNANTLKYNIIGRIVHFNTLKYNVVGPQPPPESSVLNTIALSTDALDSIPITITYDE